MATIAQHERAALADLLTELGPDAPTLCTGWSTRDLAAHLVVRERRPDAALGIALKPVAGHMESVQRSYAKRDYAGLVTMVRDGAPLWSVFGWSPVDKLLNSTEYFVHHEDVRRAQPGWEPRRLPAKVQDALWTAAKGSTGLALRGLPVGVVLARPDGSTHVGAKGEPTATVTGEPAELLLYLFGRREHARVEVTGPDEAVSALAAASLGV